MLVEEALVNITDYAKIYKSELLENILPFWERHSIDREYGGYATCVNRDGSPMDSGKPVWFQGRYAWMLAATYNGISPDPRLLELSKHGIDFIEKHCFDSDGRMFFLVERDGTPIRKRRYTFSETFATIAFAEYALATGSEEYAQKAVSLFKKVVHNLNTPGVLEPKNVNGARAGRSHSACMILINTAQVVRQVSQDPFLTKQIDKAIDEIERYFMHPEFEAVLEFVGPNGEFLNTYEGRTINPGHSIETAWFILEEAKLRGWDKRLTAIGLKILDWSWKWGWDSQYGGILYFRDCLNLPSQEYWHDMKFWWPQNEAVIATLYSYLATGDSKYLEWHQKIHQYAFSKFPDKEYGEWYGYLHRDGSVSQEAKGNYYKGPFHIPRMLLKGWLLCNEIIENRKTGL